jgi:oligopeptide/dipeptide ABC transporter ATP-binding protein
VPSGDSSFGLTSTSCWPKAGWGRSLVEGEDLAQQIARGPVPLDQAVAIARQMAAALEAVHEVGLIHRDLKPANVRVRDDGMVKVLDFGLAKALDPTGTGVPQDAANSPTFTSPALTQMGVLLGTAAYMAPEQARGKPVDKRVDIWAFGCVLYELLTGRNAFAGETITDTLAAIMTRSPDLALMPAGTPAAVSRLLARCLERDPNRMARARAVRSCSCGPRQATPRICGTWSVMPRKCCWATRTPKTSPHSRPMRRCWRTSPTLARLAFLQMSMTRFRSSLNRSPSIARAVTIGPKRSMKKSATRRPSPTRSCSRGARTRSPPQPLRTARAKFAQGAFGRPRRGDDRTSMATDPRHLLSRAPMARGEHMTECREDAVKRQRSGFAMLFVSHDLAAVERVADRTAVMYFGRIVEEGPTARIIAAAQHPYTQALLASVPIGDPRLRPRRVRLQGDPPSPAAPLSGCAFASRCPEVREICRAERPNLKPASGSHLVACHLR